MKDKRIAIIGGGIAGASTALFLGSMGLEVTLFERESSLVNGPPFCHLHAGGNLYPDISDEQCITLLHQSIAFARLFPQSIDYRPTVIALPRDGCNLSVQDLLPRLKKLQTAYATLIQEDPNNQVLGQSESYFQCYEREELERLKKEKSLRTPSKSDEWMIPLAKHLDFDRVQFPLIMVQEYGINLFRASATLSLELQQMKNIDLKFESQVIDIQREESWSLSYQEEGKRKKQNFDYLINATGFRTGIIDDMIGIECKKMVEFKAAYISQWQGVEQELFPEIIFHGKRGTPKGMGQFTPYPDGYFQLHGMTEEITLYPDGLARSSEVSCQPQLPEKFINKIEHAWRIENIEQRTNKAIQHLSRFIPEFEQAIVGAKPLFGAQQIPGDDPSLRVAEVAFPAPYYARCEIVKVSSVIDMVKAIAKELKSLHLIEENNLIPKIEKEPSEIMIQEESNRIAEERGYPISLAQRNREKS